MGFIKCGLTNEKLNEILNTLMSYSYTDILDLSENKLGENPELFIENSEHCYSLARYIRTLILFDNGFDKDSILDIKNRCYYIYDKFII